MDDTELNKRTRRFFFDDDGYWTAWTTTTTTLASQWGLLINIDSATGDIARTTSGFIEDEKHWVSVATFTSTLSSKFTSSTPYGFSGDKCIYSNVTVVPPATFCRPIEINYLKATWTFKSPLKPSTKYRIKIPVYTNTTYTSWLGIRLITSTYTSADAYVADIVIGQLQASGILNKIYVSEFTTWATVWLLSQIYARFESGIVGEIAIDLNSMTLEEVIEPVATTFDQTFTTGVASWASVGNIGGLSYMDSQSFTPTASNHSWVVLYKKAPNWTPTGNYKVDLRTDDGSGNPSSTILATTTISLANYNALPNGEFVVNLWANLTIGTKYHYVITNTATEASGNAFTLGWHAAWWYAWWDCRYSTDWWVNWVVNGTLDLYFKSFYSPLVTPSPSLVSFTAVGSTGNIDQSQLTVNDARWVWWDWSTSTITNKIAQQFLPSKSKLTWIVIRKVADVWVFTGTITAKIVNDNAWVIGTTTLASITLSNATYQAIVNDTDYTLNLPCNLTAWTLYWLTIEASTSDALNYARIRVQAGNPYTGGIFQTFYSWAWNTVVFDMYFKTLYYKPTTNFKASQNNLSVSINADEDGFLNTGVYNLLTGTYSFSQTNDTSVQIGTSSYSFIPNLFSYSTTTPNGTSDILLKSTTTMSLKWSQVWIVVGTYKINMTLLSSIVLTGCVRFAMAEWSYDNATWNTINDNRGSLTEIAISQSIPASWSYVYLRFTSWNAANASYIWSATNQLVFTWVVTTSWLSVLKNYPTNKDIIKQYSTTLWAPTISATYRATKWGFPAIEYSATEYQFLDVDTTATGSTVAFSELWTTYTTVADWASLAISSTSTPNLFVKANITANRLFSSSNDYNASSDKDGSLKQTITYQVVQ